MRDYLTISLKADTVDSYSVLLGRGDHSSEITHRFRPVPLQRRKKARDRDGILAQDGSG